MAKEPILETERLILRPHTADDAEACFVWQSDPQVNKHLAYPLVTDISQTREWLSNLGDSDSFRWGIVLKKTGELIGTCGTGASPYMQGYRSFAYNLRRDHWGRGYATEALMAMIKYVKENLCAKGFCVCHAVENPASGRVLEKCGLKFHRFGEYSKLDGSVTFKAKYYVLEFE